MAAVVSILKDIAIGATEHLYIGEIAMDNSYPTGGEAIDVAANTRFERLIPLPGGTAATGAGYKPEFDVPNQKLLMFQGDNDNAADAPAIQVPNTTDLSAITKLPFLAIGA